MGGVEKPMPATHGKANRTMSAIRTHLFSYRSLMSRNAYVVAGMGRCGTTLVFNTLRKYGLRGTRFLRSLDEHDYKRGLVYKTHDFPCFRLPDHVKLIFLFGNPMDIVISTHRKINEWGRKHHAHLRSDEFIENDCLFECDSLQLADHFDAWYRPQNFRFISVRYESMFEPDVRARLEDFLEMSVPWPEFRQRKADWMKHPRRDALWELYGPLYRRIEQAEDLKIWEPASLRQGQPASMLGT